MNEQALIQDILSGNTRSFTQLVNCYAQKLTLFVSRMVPQQLDAEEIAEDVLVKAYQHLPEHDEKKATFWTWLCRIAYNEASNFLRRSRPQIVYIDDSAITPTLTDSTAANCDADEQQEEVTRMLDKAIGQLNDDDRLMLQLYYYDNHPIDEVAFVMNKSQNNVRTHLFRIRKRLYNDIQKQLNNEYK